MMKPMRSFAQGLITQNPTLVLLLGMCPTLAISTTVTNGLGMGLAATVVLICSNALISLLRKLIPNQIRIVCYVVVIAGFVTVIDLFLQAYLPSLSASLGLFVPLIVVNCIILARGETYASKNNVFRSILDGLGMGLGFTAALLIVSTVREIMANGTWFGVQVLPESYRPVAIMGLPPGGFLVLGFVIAATQFLLKRHRKKKTFVRERGETP